MLRFPKTYIFRFFGILEQHQNIHKHSETYRNNKTGGVAVQVILTSLDSQAVYTGGQRKKRVFCTLLEQLVSKFL